MAYFKYLPKVYVRNRTIVDGNHPYQLTVNIFRRIKIKEDLQGALLGFEQYEIGEGERPDQVAYKFYGDSGLDWIILLVNNVISVYNDWPMTRYDLYDYVENKYGSVEGVHHYETFNIYSTAGELLVPEGIEVNEGYQYLRPDGSVVPKDQSRKSVTYYEYEHAINEQKRNIWMLREAYVNDFVKEFRKLAAYLPNAEIDEAGNKKTPTTLAEEFVGISNYRRPSQSTASTGSATGGGSSTALISSGGGGGGIAGTSAVVTTSTNVTSGGSSGTTTTTGNTQSDNTATSSGSDTNLGGYGY
jgi:hypothetical protein